VTPLPSPSSQSQHTPSLFEASRVKQAVFSVGRARHSGGEAGEIGGEIAQALAAKRPVIIDVVTDIDALAPRAVA
jgi:hypothetical protein